MAHGIKNYLTLFGVKINEMYCGVLTATHLNSTTTTEAQIQTKERILPK